MEVKSVLNKAASFLMKYRYAACILLIGIVLMLLPSGSPEQKQDQQSLPVTTEADSVEDQLSDLLSRIQGAGKVEVMLSYACGAETKYHTDTESEPESIRSSTVIISGSDRVESALVTRVDPPEYLGAIVLCQGADSAAVRLAIVEAVSKYTGLGADQIAVLKMK